MSNPPTTSLKDVYICAGCGFFILAIMKEDYEQDSDGKFYCQKCWQAKQRLVRLDAQLRGLKK